MLKLYKFPPALHLANSLQVHPTTTWGSSFSQQVHCLPTKSFDAIVAWMLSARPVADGKGLWIKIQMQQDTNRNEIGGYQLQEMWNLLAANMMLNLF